MSDGVIIVIGLCGSVIISMFGMRMHANALYKNWQLQYALEKRMNAHTKIHRALNKVVTELRMTITRDAFEIVDMSNTLRGVVIEYGIWADKEVTRLALSISNNILVNAGKITVGEIGINDILDDGTVSGVFEEDMFELLQTLPEKQLFEHILHRASRKKKFNKVVDSNHHARIRSQYPKNRNKKVPNR